MQYRIECIQTVFGEERERRLKLAFDIIWNLDIRKLRAEGTCSKNHDSDSSTVTVPTQKAEEESEEWHRNVQQF